MKDDELLFLCDGEMVVAEFFMPIKMLSSITNCRKRRRGCMKVLKRLLVCNATCFCSGRL